MGWVRSGLYMSRKCHLYVTYVCAMVSDCQCSFMWPNYSDVIMGAAVSQITSLTIVYPTVYSGADQRKHQSSASLAFVWEIHRWPVNSPHKGPVTWKMLPFDDVIMCSRDQAAKHLPLGILIWWELPYDILNFRSVKIVSTFGNVYHWTVSEAMFRASVCSVNCCLFSMVTMVKALLNFTVHTKGFWESILYVLIAEVSWYLVKSHRPSWLIFDQRKGIKTLKRV